MAAASVTFPSMLQASSFCSGIESRSSRKDATTSVVSFIARTACNLSSSLCPLVFHLRNSSCYSKLRTNSTRNVVRAPVLSEEETRQFCLKEFGARKALKSQGEVRMQGVQNSSGMATTDLETPGAETPENASNDSQSFVPGKADLLVVGPGVLGTLVAQQWFKVNEGECNVVGQTNTTNQHDRLRSMGIIPVTKDVQKGEKFSYVIFCAPPSGSEDYGAEVRAAAERWNGEGSLLFTSSIALYAVSDNGVCDEENAPIIPKGASPRTDRLHAAEEEVLKGKIAQRPDHVVNLIHYEDAASLCLAILRGEFRGRVFVGCDNHPVSRQEIMDAVSKSGKFDKKFEGFTTTDGPLGKRLNNDPTRRATGWTPKYESFPSFLGVTL
ncbi:hypothetical protein R1sor_014544 [Riccia sorocarpa]|uniref:NAD(P)-binding domain-containing protein n=1 Tax=Riccia sorocarpa TaxID=122646 RepID=A0ABD3HDI7_9MARC